MIHIKDVVAAPSVLIGTIEVLAAGAWVFRDISSFPADVKPSLVLLFVGCFSINARYRPIAYTIGRYGASFSSILHT